MTQERGGLAKSLILKDTKKVVILLFHSCICTNTQRPPKVNFYYVTQQGRIRIYPEFKRFSIRTKGELISDLILRLLGFADLGYKLRLLEKAGSLLHATLGKQRARMPETAETLDTKSKFCFK